MKLLMCNVAWMKRYNGITNDDHPINGGSHIEEYGYGHEVLNFQKNGEYVYGYVQARNAVININRLAPSAGDYVDNILIVWRAKSTEGSVIIGWYKNARVYRNEQYANHNREFQFQENTYTPGYHFRAKFTDAFLIPTNQRVFPVPVTHKGFGSQTFVSYLQKNNNEVKIFKKNLRSYIARVEKGDYSPPKIGKRKPISQERKVLIEKTAIDSIIEYYTKRGYDVKSVEKDNVGYDLVAVKQKKELYIEVKGTAISETDSVSVGLTPNEYNKSKNARIKYRICIVSDVLSKPMVHEFIWNANKGVWFNDQTLSRLYIKEIVSANLRII